ncbi:MAG: response regulator [Deltaproteobacteria bacterium]|nr:response regulator [Deltaproteobacteria bacterium]
MSFSRPRVLVVDDDHDCRLLLSTLVAKAGFDVDAVADGDMALATIQTRPPDLVLLDAFLPRRDGFQVCSSIKSDPATHHTPVVMLTAFASPDARSRSMAAGADEFVEKPFRADVLLELITQLMRIRDAAHQLDPGEKAVVEGLERKTDGGP